MSEGVLRKVVAAAAIGGLAAAVIKALRGEPAPQFANHPTVDGGFRPLPVTQEPDEPPVEVVVDPAEHAGEEPELPFGDEIIGDEVLADAPTELPGPNEPVGASAAATTPDQPSSSPEPAPSERSWRDPVDGACPDGYPVKAKLKSGLFHLPGMLAYDRTKPDRCYPSAEAAEADGLRPAKR